MLKALAVGVGIFVPVQTCTPATPIMSLAEAEAYCAPQANKYARRPIPVVVGGTIQVGLLAEFPDDFMVQDYYRRCVYANSGLRASGRVKWRV